MTLIFMEVFGKDAGPGLFGDFMRLQESGDTGVQRGMMRGGKEICDWMSDSKKTPMGWASYVHGV